MRQLGGAFGVAIVGAAFAATGSYASPTEFSHGFVTAFAVAAGLALAAASAGTILPGRRGQASPAMSQEPGTPAGAAVPSPSAQRTADQERVSVVLRQDGR